MVLAGRSRGTAGASGVEGVEGVLAAGRPTRATINFCANQGPLLSIEFDPPSKKKAGIWPPAFYADRGTCTSEAGRRSRRIALDSSFVSDSSVQVQPVSVRDADNSEDLQMAIRQRPSQPRPAIRPGQIVPDSGIYRTGGGRQSTLVKGEPAPPTPKSGQQCLKAGDEIAKATLCGLDLPCELAAFSRKCGDNVWL